MKKLLLTLLLIFATIIQTSAQDKIDTHMRQGIMLHDEGKLDEAIEEFTKVLEINPKSPIANYEIGFTYFEKQEYPNAIKHMNVVLKAKDEQIKPMAYLVKASAIDNMGNAKEAIKIYKKTIKEFGESFLVRYNMGITYYKQGDLTNAEDSFLKAIELNPTHASSHFQLASIMMQTDNKIKSMLGYFYFLTLENNTFRSDEAYSNILKMMHENVTRANDEKKTINIIIDPKDTKESEFGIVSMGLTLSVAANATEEYKDKSKEELFYRNTEILFNLLPIEVKNNNVWFDIYIPFFKKLVASGHSETFSYYVAQNSNKESKIWILSHINEADELMKWIGENIK